MSEHTELSDAIDRSRASGDRHQIRSDRSVARLTIAVGVLAAGVFVLALLTLIMAFGRAADHDAIAKASDVIDKVSTQNDRLAEVLDSRTPIIERIDASEARTACLVRELGRTFVAGVRVLLTEDSNPAAVELLADLEASLATLEDAVQGVCPGDQGAG